MNGHDPRTPADGLSLTRVAAMVERYWYLLRSSWPRLLELVYWPAVQMLMWGFLQTYVSQSTGFFARAGGTFIGAVLLWDILFRGQLGFSISFLEEMWSRNLANLMMSPLRPVEFIAALMIMSVVRLAIGMVPVSFLAIAFFGFNLWELGLALAAFFANLLLTSWAIGIFVSGLVLRNGLGAENLAWTIMFIFLPLTCVYYPVSEPKDQVESMLAAQMAGIHIATMTMMRRLTHAELIDQQNSAERALNKLARTFALQMEALKRYRTGGEQRVTVQHVSVSQGGQAIVGNVTQGSRESTADKVSSVPQLTHAKEAPMTVLGAEARTPEPVGAPRRRPKSDGKSST
jgi:ABC-2 type transport system permease protein